MLRPAAFRTPWYVIISKNYIFCPAFPVLFAFFRFATFSFYSIAGSSAKKQRGDEQYADAAEAAEHAVT